MNRPFGAGRLISIITPKVTLPSATPQPTTPERPEHWPHR